RKTPPVCHTHARTRSCNSPRGTCSARYSAPCSATSATPVALARDDHVFDRFAPGSVTPVAVGLRPQAESLVTFEHPADALYVFGPEDGSLPRAVRLRCHRFVVLPTHHCLNLAAAVNGVRYDRRLKRHLAGLEPLSPVRELLREHRGPLDIVGIKEFVRFSVAVAAFQPEGCATHRPPP